MEFPCIESRFLEATAMAPSPVPTRSSSNPRPWLAAIFLGCLAISARAEDFPQAPPGWPAVTAINKPWTRWWWLGSAVDKPNLTRQLEDFAKTGLGGGEICPIYGAVGG